MIHTNANNLQVQKKKEKKGFTHTGPSKSSLQMSVTAQNEDPLTGHRSAAGRRLMVRHWVGRKQEDRHCGGFSSQTHQGDMAAVACNEL